MSALLTNYPMLAAKVNQLAFRGLYESLSYFCHSVSAVLYNRSY